MSTKTPSFRPPPDPTEPHQTPPKQQCLLFEQHSCIWWALLTKNKQKGGTSAFLPQAEAERPPRACWPAWSGVGRRGSVLSSPPCLRFLVPSSCLLYLVLVSVLLCGLLGMPAAWFSAAAVAVRAVSLPSSGGRGDFLYHRPQW